MISDASSYVTLRIDAAVTVGLEFNAVVTAAALEVDAAVTFAPEIVMVALEIDAAVKVAPEIDAVALEVVTFRGVRGGKL